MCVPRPRRIPLPHSQRMLSLLRTHSQAQILNQKNKQRLTSSIVSDFLSAQTQVIISTHLILLWLDYFVNTDQFKMCSYRKNPHLIRPITTANKER